MNKTSGDESAESNPPNSGGNYFKPKVRICVFVFVVSVSFFFLYKPGSISLSWSSLPMMYGRFPGKFDAELSRVLKNASMADKTVILTTVNEAWAQPHAMEDVFFESFKIGNDTARLLNNLVVVCMDQKAYKLCISVHPHCYALKTPGLNFSGDAYFMTPTYLEMMWRRIDFLTTVLKMGYNFVFTDADIVWFQNPFPRFYPDGDFQIACDGYLGDPDDRKNRPNGGFNYVKSNNRTIQFYKFWYSSREAHPGLHDQDVLNLIKNDSLIDQIGLKMKFLDTKYFGGFCEPSKDFNEVCTMHANCCTGMDRKIHDLKLVIEDWKSFMSLNQTTRALSSPSWRAPQDCRL